MPVADQTVRTAGNPGDCVPTPGGVAACSHRLAIGSYSSIDSCSIEPPIVATRPPYWPKQPSASHDLCLANEPSDLLEDRIETLRHLRGASTHSTQTTVERSQPETSPSRSHVQSSLRVPLVPARVLASPGTFIRSFMGAPGAQLSPSRV